MSRTWLLFLSCLFILLALIAPSRAGLTLRVDESATRILFAGQTRVSLAIENPLNAAVAAQVKIELLDTHGQIRGKAAHAQLLKRGTNVVVIPIEVRLTEDGAADTRELLWYRLRYHVEPSAGSQFDQIKGVVSLSGIAPDIFAIQVASAQKAQEGAAFRLRVRAAHPLTAQPVASVSIEAEITFSADPDDIVLKRSSQTDANGFATLDFQIPRGLEDSEGDIEVTARRGILIASADSEVNLNRQTQLLVSTDKPLYQPGQTLHVRVLMFDAARRAMANKSVTVKLRDPESTTAFRTELTTSRFGVASADWNIPDNARLGDYLVEVTFEDDKSEDAYSGTSVKVSRYELPNFSVNIKPDRPYYLPGQDAQVEVRADYLFGQPVKRGHVRVVRETERHWNYREQKYETEEGDKYAGEVNADGSFVARIKLADEHENLKGEDYSRYRDLSYAAYFTDATTNRTEQRRFDLRLTKNAIHVYVVNRHLPQAHNFPLEFYVSTSYADGSPALCDVAISQLRNDHPPTEQSLQTIKTNRYGLAKVSRLTLPKPEADEDEISLILRARDSQSAAGQHTETLSFERDQPVIRVETDKSLYRDGEPIRTQITASEADLTVVVDAVNEDKVVQSQLVRLKNGRAEITIPYRPDFIGPITVAAYVMAPQDNDEVAQGLRTVLYPRDRDLKFKLDLNQVSYRPGEEASATFLTRTANGLAAESALGVVIFDKAVEERARTDREFGGSYGFYAAYSYLSGANDNVAGVSRKDLERLDLTKPLPEGLELVAEVFLTHYIFQPRLFQSRAAQSDGSVVFANFLKGEINVLRDRLETEYKAKYVYPTDLASLRRFSAVAGINIDGWRDPWEMPYRASFFAESSSDVFVLASAGADKRFDTADDFSVLRINRPYFRFTGEAINRAVTSYHMRTGGFIREAATLGDELRREGIEIDRLRDPWGQPYEISFGVSGTKFQVHARTSGPDRKFTIEDSDDIGLWTASIDYSIDLQTKIDSALTNYFQATSRVPQDEAEFKEALKRSNVNSDELCDPWGRPYYVTFKQNAIYGDRVRIFSYATYGQKPKEKTELTPVTQQMNFIYLRSGGEDGQSGTPDDFNVVTFSRLVAEQAGNEPDPQLETRPVVLPGSTGAITGTVVDVNDAVIPNARVAARHLRNTAEFSATTSDDGTYILRNLPAGLYELTVDAPGFLRTVITDVPVRSSSITRVNLTLEVAGVSETVTVAGSASGLLDMTTSESVSVSRSDGVTLITKSGTTGQQLSTPRLREYFPETLLWQPSLETDKHGRALIKFKLADNITTWKMSVIGSTEDGEIGFVEKEIKAFQPFFVEHDPPRILTEGDEISLPVVVRNYLDRPQPINLEIKPENWFTLIGPAAKRSEVLAGDASRQTFDFRATASIKDGKQRITAIGADANDAIEKPVTVHPDGEEKSVTASDIVSGNGTLTLEIPQSVIANSMRAELKIYPNLLAHVAESVEAIMARPYGCGEQTISSTYPSLLYLKHSKRMNRSANAVESNLNTKAARYLRAGYERLLNYRHESGGFTYWGRGEPDLALTAYALRFLNETREFTTVDDNVIKAAAEWLLKQQRTDGSWSVNDYGSKIEDKRRAALLTAYVARVLAMSTRAEGIASKPAGEPLKSFSPELKRALDYLAARTAEIDEPYLIASFALAALDAGDAARAEKATAKLRALAHQENGGVYWSLETNTPFYGWGLAGRIETTSLAVQALARDRHRLENESLVRGGLLFMLKQKDRYGVWYSTQATINVLDSLIVLLTRDDAAAHGLATATAEIFANGRSVKSVALPQPHQLASPITVDLSQFIQAGSNRIEVRRSQATSPASVQAVATYYLPWSESVATQNANWRANGSSGLRLLTKFDKTEGKVSDEITCHVEAERIGFSGYGMLLAEIGLPPGADVDRASLDQAMKGSEWSISQYDILPDRVVVYLWPRAGGTKFDFKFRPRFGLNAQTAASIVYDYYNPEARAIVAPERFVVK